MAADTSARIDLNLLLALDALLDERSVTRAADRLGVSQPAVSASLARLRRHYGDQILDRVGNRYELTPLAQQLRIETSVALSATRRVFDAMPTFDPATATTAFTIGTSDYAATVLGESLSHALATEAPAVRLRLVSNSPHVIDDIDTTLRAVDGILIPHGFIHDVPHLDLFTDDWVGVADRGNMRVNGGLSLRDLPEMPWVVTFDSRTAFTPALQHLRMLGVEPEVRVVVENFISVPFFVAGTDRIALLQRRLADRIAALADVQVFELPFEAVQLVESFWWHPMHRSNPAHVWFRQLLQRVGDHVDATGQLAGGLTDRPTRR